MNIWHDKVKPLVYGLFPKPLTDSDVSFIRQYLNKQEQILFYRMQNIDQRHALDTSFKLKELIGRRMKLNQDKLYMAALLHDVGKVAYPISLGSRVTSTITFKLFKSFSNWLADKGVNGKKPKGWLIRSLYLHKYHPQLGAELVRELKVDENVAYLIEHHHDELAATEPIELTLLREADMWN